MDTGQNKSEILKNYEGNLMVLLEFVQDGDKRKLEELIDLPIENIKSKGNIFFNLKIMILLKGKFLS